MIQTESVKGSQASEEDKTTYDDSSYNTTTLQSIIDESDSQVPSTQPRISEPQIILFLVLRYYAFYAYIICAICIFD